MRKIFLLSIILISFSMWSEVPGGYYHSATNKSNSELKTALFQIISKAKTLGYGGGEGKTWEGFFYTDHNEDGSVIDMYSNLIFYQPTFMSVTGMHIEHSLPKSWWGTLENNAYRDLYHLYPAEANINIRKNNLPLGEADENAYTNGLSKVGQNTFGSEYTKNCFEPADEYKGDFARSYFYMATAYEDMADRWNSPMMNNNTYPVWKPWAIDLLLKWHKEDPVSQKELDREEEVYKIQGNRNPYIDYPELVEYIWGGKQNQSFVFPEGTTPFISSPTVHDNISFGVVKSGGNYEYKLNIQGGNLTQNINLELVNKDVTSLSLNSNSISASNVNNGAIVTITLNGNLSAVINDTLQISSAEVNNLRIPISATISGDIMAIPPTDITSTTATLSFMKQANTSESKLYFYEGISPQSGDLFISTYIEGSSNNKAIEIFNATGKSVDLSTYSLKIQSNGVGGWNAPIPLTGTLDNNKSHIIVNFGEKGTASEELRAYATQLSQLLFNGNDAVALFHNNILIDMVGIYNGVDNWGNDMTLSRKSHNPMAIFDWEEWEKSDIDNFAKLNTYSYTSNGSDGAKTEYDVTDKITINGLSPNSDYYYTVFSGNKLSANIVNFKTHKLDIPVVLEPINIFKSEFEATWEDVEGAQSYIFDLYKVSGNGVQTYTTGFEGLGSNGTPLPTGWEGTASGNYTTTASSGAAAPSIAFKNSNEYLQSPKFDGGINSLSFMYRFPSSGAGNTLHVEGLNNGEWETIQLISFVDTKKYYPSYTFDETKKYTTIRWTFNKVSGNLALDDVSIEYGNEVMTPVISNKIVTETTFKPTNLESISQYAYSVKAYHPAYTSPASDLIRVTTTNEEPSHVDVTKFNDNLKLSRINGAWRLISQESPISSIRIYSIQGSVVWNDNSNANEVELPTLSRGVYVGIAIVNNQPYSFKVIY